MLAYARRNGVRNIVFYGDIAHTPNLSPESMLAFLHLLQNNTDLRFIVMTGNHDVESSGHHSLRILQHIASHWLSHVKVLSKPKVLRVDGQLLNVLPWPYHETRENACNVLHHEVRGSKWDSGRETGSKLELEPHHFCVAGHLHTAQVVGNVHFSGTLYQTNFAEKEEKYFHHVRYNGKKGTAELIPHKPSITLRNIVIRSAHDLDSVPDDPSVLCKLFVKRGVDLDPGELERRPNVVKFNSFQTKHELEVLINEDIFIADNSAAAEFDYRDMLQDWLGETKVAPELGKKTLALFDTLLRPSSNKADTNV